METLGLSGTAMNEPKKRESWVSTALDLLGDVISGLFEIVSALFDIISLF